MRLQLKTINRAFDDPAELPRIIRAVAAKIESGKKSGTIKDSNGYRVGAWKL